MQSVEVRDVNEDGILLFVPTSGKTMKTINPKTGKVTEHIYSTKDRTGWNSCENVALPSGKFLPVNLYLGKPKESIATPKGRPVEEGQAFEF